MSSFGCAIAICWWRSFPSFGSIRGFRYPTHARCRCEIVIGMQVRPGLLQLVGQPKE